MYRASVCYQLHQITIENPIQIIVFMCENPIVHVLQRVLDFDLTFPELQELDWTSVKRYVEVNIKISS